MFLPGKDENSFWWFERQVLIYVFDEFLFEQHLLVYKSRENALCTREGPRDASSFHMESDTILAEKIVPATWMQQFRSYFKNKKSKGPKIEKQ